MLHRSSCMSLTTAPRQGTARGLGAMQVRAAATETAQRASGVWRVPAVPTVVPSPDPAPARPAHLPAATHPALAGSTPAVDVPSSIPPRIKSPHAIAATLQDPRLPRRSSSPGASPGTSPPADSPIDGARAVLFGSPPRQIGVVAVAHAPAPEAAAADLQPAKTIQTQGSRNAAGPGTLPLAGPLLDRRGPPPAGQRAARRNSHRTLRTLKVGAGRV